MNSKDGSSSEKGVRGDSPSLLFYQMKLPGKKVNFKGKSGEANRVTRVKQRMQGKSKEPDAGIKSEKFKVLFYKSRFIFFPILQSILFNLL